MKCYFHVIGIIYAGLIIYRKSNENNVEKNVNENANQTQKTTVRRQGTPQYEMIKMKI